MRFRTALTILCATIFQAISASAQPVPPELPRTYLDTTFSAPTGAARRPLTAIELQAAINAANCGDVIYLRAGTTYVGNFELAPKNCTGVITIMTEATLPPPGRRMTPALAAPLAKLVTNTVAPALRGGPRASNYRLVGFEVTTTANYNYNLTYFGSETNVASDIPRNIILDRLYIHGDAEKNVRRGVGLNSAASAVIDSYISDCHEAGADSQAIGSWASPGPIKIVNNYLEGGSENVMFGGAMPSVTGVIPSDLEIRGNHLRKNPIWNPNYPGYNGKNWVAKNLFETKSSRRLLLEGNVLENNWVQGQVGFAILITPRSGQSGSWTVTEDTTIRNNIIKNTNQGVNISTYDDTDSSLPPGTKQTNRVAIINNLFENVGYMPWGTGGRLLQLLDGPLNIAFDHNTAFNSGTAVIIDSNTKMNWFSFNNNILQFGDYGLHNTAGIGTAGLNATTTQYSFRRNVMILNKYDPADYSSTPASIAPRFPAENYYPTSGGAVGFVSYSGPTGGDYRLAAGSSYKNQALDGTDIGVNMTALLQATRSAVSGESTTDSAAPAAPSNVRLN